MTILSSTVGNVANQSVDKSVWIKAARLRQGTVTGSVVVPERIEVKPVAGVLTTPELQPGPAVVTWGIDTYYVTIPASGTVSWWSVLALAVGVPPGTSEESIAQALAVYLDANPIEGGGLTVDQIATAATTSTPLKTALDQSYVPLAASAKDLDALFAGDMVRNVNGVITSFTARWPDGSPGTYTTLAIDPSGAVNSYQVTYGSPVTKTFTQPTITRDSSGAATTIPAVVVS